MFRCPSLRTRQYLFETTPKPRSSNPRLRVETGSHRQTEPPLTELGGIGVKRVDILPVSRTWGVPPTFQFHWWYPSGTNETCYRRGNLITSEGSTGETSHGPRTLHSRPTNIGLSPQWDLCVLRKTHSRFFPDTLPGPNTVEGQDYTIVNLDGVHTRQVGFGDRLPTVKWVSVEMTSERHLLTIRMGVGSSARNYSINLLRSEVQIFRRSNSWVCVPRIGFLSQTPSRSTVRDVDLHGRHGYHREKRLSGGSERDSHLESVFTFRGLQK